MHEHGGGGGRMAGAREHSLAEGNRGPAMSEVRLHGSSGPATGRVYRLPHVPSADQGWLIGRSRECDIAVLDPDLSREHARLFCRAGDFYIVDLDSHNGTEVAGTRIASGVPVRLRDGATIRLGGSSLRFRAPSRFRSRTRAMDDRDGRTPVAIIDGHGQTQSWTAGALQGLALSIAVAAGGALLGLLAGLD